MPCAAGHNLHTPRAGQALFGKGGGIFLSPFQHSGFQLFPRSRSASPLPHHWMLDVGQNRQISRLPLPDEQGTWDSPVQRHETEGVLAGQFNQVTIGDRPRRLHKRRQMRRAEVVRNQLKANPR